MYANYMKISQHRRKQAQIRKQHMYSFNTDADHCVAVITYNYTSKMDSHIWRYSASYKNMIEILIEATDINFKILSTGRNS